MSQKSSYAFSLNRPCQQRAGSLSLGGGFDGRLPPTSREVLFSECGISASRAWRCKRYARVLAVLPSRYLEQ
jgi:hypothetical protein